MATTQFPPNQSRANESQTTASATPGAPIAASHRSALPKRIAARLMNPFIRMFAGKRRARMFAVIEHRGRKSGRVYSTPVAARPTKEKDGFLVPMAFGENADWFRNVQAAGGCTIRWDGKAVALVDPEIIDWATARSSFSPIERIFAPIFANRFVRLRRAPTA